MSSPNYLVPVRQNLRIPQQQTVDYFQAALGKPLGELGNMVVNTTPIVAAARKLQQRRLVPNAASGLGQVDNIGTVGIVLLAGFVLLTGALSYQAGKAMAPNKGASKSWGWVGVPVGIFTGPWGLGVMGIISNSTSGK